MAPRIARCFPLLAWLLLVERSVAGPRKKKDEDPNKVALAHHSFAAPLSYSEVLNDWRVGGASIVETERLLLHPSVPGRAAFVWNKAPILTNDFEVTVHFRVTGAKEVAKVVDDQSFAVWYAYENVSASYKETNLGKASDLGTGLAESGMSFSGFKSKFKGFGAIFSMVDAKKNPKAVVSGIWNAGDRDLAYGAGRDVPTADAKAIDFRNTMNAAQFRLRVTPTSIVGYLKQSKSLSWNECFKLDRTADQVQPGGYIGMTAWSGASSPPATTSDTIAITQFEVNNFDSNVVGEELVDVSKQIQDAYREMLTDENRHFVDQKSQTEHIARLERMIKQHLEATKPADQKVFNDLESLVERARLLDEKGRTLTRELQVIVGDDGSPHAALKNEIVGLRRLFSKDQASHREKLDLVQQNLAEVRQRRSNTMKRGTFGREVEQQVAAMESTSASRSKRTVWFLLALLVVVAVFGYMMFNKMQYYERKHFL